MERSIETYINNVQLKEDFKKVSNVLRLRKIGNSNGRIEDLEEVMKLMSNALGELLRPIVERMWHEKQQYQQKQEYQPNTIGLMIMPDFKHMEPQAILKEYVKLLRK